MQDFIIIAVLLAVVVIALLRAVRHFRGGGCCGSGNNVIRIKKELNGPKLGEKILDIQGMHCENCEIRVENALNRLDGIACRASHRKKTAVVSYSVPVSDDVLKEAVEKLGYKVTSIR